MGQHSESKSVSETQPEKPRQHDQVRVSIGTIRTVQELLVHVSVETTMIYTHVMNKGGRGVTSHLDRVEQARPDYAASAMPPATL